MRGGDHDAAVKIIYTGDIGNGGSGGDMHDVGICPAGHESGAECILKHIGGTAGIFADDDFCFFILIHAVIPAEKTADFDGMVKSEVFVGFPTEAVGAEVFSHLRNSPFIWITSHRKTVGKGANQVLGRQVPTS